MKNMPPGFEMAVFEINPATAYFLDNTVSFGHRDRVEYSD